MSWLNRYRLRNFLYSSFWVAPACSIVFAILICRSLRALDEIYGWEVLGFTPAGAHAVLGSFIASMLTFVVVLVSSLLLVVQLVSSQLTPRIIAPAFHHPLIRITLSILLFSYAFSVKVESRVTDTVPQLAVATAIVINILCVLLFLYFVGAIGLSLRPTYILTTTAARGRTVIMDVYPNAYDASACEDSLALPNPQQNAPSITVEHERGSGVVVALDQAGLVLLAKRQGCVIEVVPRVGDFVAAGEPLFRVHGCPSIDPCELRKHVLLDAERTLPQDPGLAFRIVVDIATRSLSSSINDPSTAVLAIDQVHRLLRCVGTRTLDSGRLTDNSGVVRLIIPTPSWDEFVWLSTAEIRHYGASSVQVCERMRSMLEHLLQVLPEKRHNSLREQLNLLDRAIDQTFSAPEDRRRLHSSGMNAANAANTQMADGGPKSNDDSRQAG